MVVIRLSRGGAKKAPFYHLVAADKRNRRDGRCLERLGYFNPCARGQAIRLEINMDRIDHWVSQGAQPSDRVKKLISEHKLGAEKVTELRDAKQKKQHAKKEAAQKAKEAETEAAAETKAE